VICCSSLQVAGKVVDAEVVETPFGASDLGFFMIVALVTLGTLVSGCATCCDRVHVMEDRHCKSNKQQPVV
jgi:hypothetical protein